MVHVIGVQYPSQKSASATHQMIAFAEGARFFYSSECNDIFSAAPEGTRWRPQHDRSQPKYARA
jgi:hypothetical protein